MKAQRRAQGLSPSLSQQSRLAGDSHQARSGRGKPGKRRPLQMEESREGEPAVIDLGEDRQRALAMFDVSRETILRLDRFVDLLLTWQRQTNLVSPSTVPSLWTRHVADSLQLLDLVKASYREPSVWIDLGTGGGFPGLVLACALADVPGAHVHLIESNLKKAAFLREAARETKVPATVHAARIETLVPTLGTVATYVTARALAPLPDLLEMIAPFLKKGAKALLLKGQDIDHELTESTKHWNIRSEIMPSRTSTAGRILIVHALSRRASASSGHAGEGRVGASSRPKPHGGE